MLLLFLVELGVDASRAGLAAGVLFSVAALSAAAGHQWAAPLMAGRPVRRLVAVSAAAGALALGGLSLSDSLVVAAACTMVFSLMSGIAMTAAYATAGRAVPASAHTTGFSLMTSASLAGMAISPVVAGVVAGASLRLVFAAGALLLVAVGAWAGTQLPARADAA